MFCIGQSGRWPLACLVTALLACTDDVHPPTAPLVDHQPRASVGFELVVTNTSNGDEVGSLRWALQQASGGDVIKFDPSLAGQTITLDSELDVSTVVTIEGPENGGITISGGDATRVLRVRLGATLRNLTIRNGYGGGIGSAIWAQGPVQLEHSTVTDNHGTGAAIHGHDLTFINSTVSGNTGMGTASGISYGNGGHLRLYNSTVSHNYPAPGIGPASNPGTVGTVLMQNSITSSNGDPQMNCWTSDGVFHSRNNLSNDTSCGISEHMLVADPLLLGLSDNGGPTMTQAFSVQSPALNAGINCDVSVDQRYVPRDAYCDVGAFEFTDFTVITMTIDAMHSVNSADGTVVISGALKCSRPESFGLLIQVHQSQKIGKTSTAVRGSAGVGVDCSTSAQPWTATITASSGAFQTGSAIVTAQTNDTPIWVTPTSAERSVKLVRKK